MFGLMAIEKMLICLVKPSLSIYKSGSCSYSGSQYFEKMLPHKIIDMQLSIEEITEEDGFSQEWVVRSSKVREALLWLINITSTIKMLSYMCSARILESYLVTLSSVMP